MLRQRVITALVMAGLFVSAVALLPLPALALLLGLVVCAGGWEWSRLAGFEHAAARAAFVAVLLAILVCLYIVCGLYDQPEREQVQPFLGLACLWWSFALLWIRGYPGSAGIWRNSAMRSLMGLLALAPAWLSAVYLLTLPRGGILLAVLVIIVASTDIGAYFSGKALGKHKLAPNVSPAKTWEGFWGGIAAAAALAVVINALLPVQVAHIGMASVAAVTITTALASVVGDLTVSMVKRESGVKDSGTLLPGHGGLLDRLDSLAGAAPVFALGLLLAGW